MSRRDVAVGYTTRRDLTSMGSFMTMGLFGLIIALAGQHLHAVGCDLWAISVLGVVVFVGPTAYDTQRRSERCRGGEAGLATSR